MTELVKKPDNVVSTLLSNKGYSVLKADLGALGVKRLKKELTVKPQSHPNYPDATPFPAYDEGERWIRIPRYFGLDKYGPPRTTAFSSINNDVERNSRLSFSGELWPAQAAPHDQLLVHIKSKGSGLLCLHTAGGKTVITLSLISALNQRTCVLVHKSQLLQQWKERIVQFLPAAKVSVIQGKEKDFSQDSDVYLVMIQTLLNIPTVPSIFGFTIIDECHHLPSETFSRVLFKVNAQYMLGLSATPERKDGLTNLLHWHLGEIVYQEKPDRSGHFTTQVDFLRFDSSALNLDVKKYSQCITKLSEHGERNEYIINSVLEIFQQDENHQRRLLILTDRVVHATHLWKTLTDLKTQLGDRTCGILVAGMNQTTFKAETKCDIIVATFGLMLEGIDIPELNGILLATPRRSVAQAIGRILRKVHTDIHPLIADVSDSSFRGQERARLSTYKTELNGNIKVEYKEL